LFPLKACLAGTLLFQHSRGMLGNLGNRITVVDSRGPVDMASSLLAIEATATESLISRLTEGKKMKHWISNGKSRTTPHSMFTGFAASTFLQT
jgi:hypothetical protein